MKKNRKAKRSRAVEAKPLFKSTRRSGASRSGRVRSRALNIRFGENPIIRLSEDVFRVPSETIGGRYYTVNLRRRTCECSDWRKHQEDCKHIAAALLDRSGDTIRPSEFTSRSGFRNPPHYDRLRRVRMRCVYELLRCVKGWVDHG